MTHQTLLDEYLAGPALVREAIAGMSDEQLRARPIADRWTTQEVVCHLADFEMIMAIRMRRVLAENEPTLLGANQDLFVARLAYDQRNPAEEIALMELVRRQMARILRAAAPGDFARVGHHNELGPVALETLLRRITRHIPHHLAFVAEKRRALGC